ncbi:MAG: phosphotransferase [Actinobacteria bacterium]|nr:phosphotransferase [Actinomycetota bacterium]
MDTTEEFDDNTPAETAVRPPGIRWFPASDTGRYRFVELVRATGGGQGEAEIWRVELELNDAPSRGPMILKRRARGRLQESAWLAEQEALRRLRRVAPAEAGAPTWSVPDLVASWSDEDYLFMLMTEVIGPTVESLIESAGNGRVPLPEARRIFVGLSDALCASHQAGVVHGDLSPTNVIVHPSQNVAVVVLDWGMANIDGNLERPRGFTSIWAPSSLLRGEPPNAFTDVWSLARLCFFLLTGRRPATTRELVSQYRPDVGAGVDRVLGEVLNDETAAGGYDAARFQLALLRALPNEEADTDRVAAIRSRCRDALSSGETALVLNDVAELRGFDVRTRPDAWWAAATILAELAATTASELDRVEAADAFLTLIRAGQFERVGLGDDGGQLLRELDPWIRAGFAAGHMDPDREVRDLWDVWIGSDPVRRRQAPRTSRPVPTRRELATAVAVIVAVSLATLGTVVVTDSERLFVRRSVIADVVWVAALAALVAGLAGAYVIFRLAPWKPGARLRKACGAGGAALAILLLLIALPLRSQGPGFLPAGLARAVRHAPGWLLGPPAPRVFAGLRKLARPMTPTTETTAEPDSTSLTSVPTTTLLEVATAPSVNVPATEPSPDPLSASESVDASSLFYEGCPGVTSTVVHLRAAGGRPPYQVDPGSIYFVNPDNGTTYGAAQFKDSPNVHQVAKGVDITIGPFHDNHRATVVEVGNATVYDRDYESTSPPSVFVNLREC